MDIFKWIEAKSKAPKEPADNASLTRYEMKINSIYLCLIGERNSINSRFIENGFSKSNVEQNEDMATVLTDRVHQQLERYATVAENWNEFWRFFFCSSFDTRVIVENVKHDRSHTTIGILCGLTISNKIEAIFEAL